MQQIKEWQAVLKDLAELNRQLGITAVYQNHAGRDYFGASLWDLHHALQDVDPALVGIAFDIRHATVEAGTAWPISFQLLRPHLQAVCVKDFRWVNGTVENVTLGAGHISPTFFSMLVKSNYRGPISLHEEYLDHRDPTLVPQHLKGIRNDLAKLKSWLADA